MNHEHPRAAGTAGTLPLSALAVLLGMSGCAVLPESAAPETTPEPAGAPFPVDYEIRELLDAAVVEDDFMYKLLVAEFAARRGLPTVALTEYMETARITQDPGVARHAARVAFAQNSDEALEAAEIWSNLAPGDADASQVAALLHVRAGNFDRAVHYFEQLLANAGPDSGINMLTIAELLSQQRNNRTGLEVMRQLSDRRPDDSTAVLAFAMMAIGAGQTGEAEAAMQRLTAMPDMDATTALAYVSFLVSQRQIDRAVDWLDSQLDTHPGDTDLRRGYARLLMQTERLDDARREYQKLLEGDPRNVDALYSLGLIEWESERIPEAEDYFRGVIAMGAPIADQARYHLGQIAENRNDTATALEHYSAVRGGQNYFAAQAHAAYILSSDGRVAEARARLHRVSPRSVDERNQLAIWEGDILRTHELYAEAVKVYDAALQENFDADLLYARAMVAEKLDRLDWLERDLRAIIARDPEHAENTTVEALNALGYTLADRTDRYEEALVLVQRALQLKPGEMHILDSMGWVLYRLGRLPQAVEYLERARQIENDPEIAAHLGEVLWVMGERERARDVFDRALVETPGAPKVLETMERLAVR